MIIGVVATVKRLRHRAAHLPGFLWHEVRCWFDYGEMMRKKIELVVSGPPGGKGGWFVAWTQDGIMVSE